MTMLSGLASVRYLVPARAPVTLGGRGEPQRAAIVSSTLRPRTRDAGRVGRRPEHGLDAVDVLGARHEVSRLDGPRRGHVGEVVHRPHVAQVDGDPELELHVPQIVTARSAGVETPDSDASRSVILRVEPLVVLPLAGRESLSRGALPPRREECAVCGPVSPSLQRSLSARGSNGSRSAVTPHLRSLPRRAQDGFL